MSWSSTARHCRLPSTQMSPARSRSRSASRVAASQIRRDPTAGDRARRPARPGAESRSAGSPAIACGRRLRRRRAAARRRAASGRLPERRGAGRRRERPGRAGAAPARRGRQGRQVRLVRPSEALGLGHARASRSQPMESATAASRSRAVLVGLDQRGAQSREQADLVVDGAGIAQDGLLLARLRRGGTCGRRRDRTGRHRRRSAA